MWPDFALGRNREGNIEKLTLLGPKLGFSVEVVPVYSFSEGEIPIRSSEARKELSKGNIKSLNEMLGRRFRLSGMVDPGNHMGTELGFPTANIKIKDENKLIPNNGVYIIASSIDSKTYYGMMNIGKNPTFTDKDQSIEVHFFDLDYDIYDKTITIKLIKRIRDEKKFNSPELLREQLELDKDFTFKYLEENEIEIK